MVGGAWKAAVHGVAKSLTRLSDFTFTFQFHTLEKEMTTYSSVLAWRIPGTGGAWWAAVSGVAQSQPRMKRLSSSSSSNAHHGAWHSVGTRESLLNLDVEVTVQIPHGPDFRGLPATAPQQLLPPAPGCMANLPQACRTYQGPRPCQSNAYQSRENSPALRLEALQQ